jgi:hypothetical protein
MTREERVTRIGFILAVLYVVYSCGPNLLAFVFTH